MDLRIELDTREFDTKLGKLPKQIPFAMSKAINATAADSVTVLKSRLDDDFTLRSGWIAKGIRYDPSNKRKLVAIVGSVDRFMEQQAAGGERDAKGEHGQPVPLVGKGRARSKLEAVTRPSRWPGALAEERDDVFIGPRRFSGDDREGVWQRVMVGKGKSRRPGLRLLYTVADKVSIKPRWKLLPVVQEVVRERWADHAASAIQEALDTAR